MRTRPLLILVALVPWACGSSGSSPAIELTSINGNGTYSACVPGTADIGLGGIIVALTDGGAPPELDDGRVVDPASDVRIDTIEIEAPAGSVELAAGAPVLQVVGLDSAFAVPVSADHRSIAPEAGQAVTARPNGVLGAPVTLGWHSLVVPVRPTGDMLAVHDIAVTYRVGDRQPVRGRLGMAWQLCLDDCGPECPPAADAEVPPGEAGEWVTVFETTEADAWEVTTELPG
ncbi:MAG: hypothetical protein OES57_08910 [Acidimicrobiia bacterium]|nr:hypothetical protein [Acidimicrobiia bacterium]